MSAILIKKDSHKNQIKYLINKLPVCFVSPANELRRLQGRQSISMPYYFIRGLPFRHFED